MQKVAMVIPQGKRGHAVRLLGELGVVHVQCRSGPIAGPAERGLNIEKIESAIRILDSLKPPGGTPESIGVPEIDCLALAERILEPERRRKELVQNLIDFKGQETRIEPLGEFDPQTLRRLVERGLTLRVYRCSRANLRSVPASVACSVVAKVKGEVYLAALSRDAETKLPFPEIELPGISLDALRSRISGAEKDLAEAESELFSLVGSLRALRTEVDRLHRGLEFDQVVESFRVDPPVAVLEGYCPETEIGKLKNLAERHRWALLSEKPGRTDAPPTLIAYSQWIDAVQPMYRLINSFPGYREPDISFWFLSYFAIFVAILIGDAGYGALLIVGVALFHARGNAPPPLLRLGWILGGATAVWGALTGNWFGIKAISELPVFRTLIISGLGAFSSESQENLMLLCFLIGASHLTVAHLVLAFRQRRSLAALGQVGWALIVWGAFFVVRFLVLEVPIPLFTYSLLGAGAILVIVFTQPDSNLLRGLGVGVGKLPLKLVNCFSDIISYIRLFAVGMATLAVAVSFNEIATAFGSGGPSGIFLAAFVLLIGHGINVLMAGLAVIVHGIRLNMLEFSGHAEMEWSGSEYKPFTIAHDQDLERIG